MKLSARTRSWRGSKCRYCKTKSQWEFSRGGTWRYNDDALCDAHFGLALRNAGVTSLSIEHTATVTAEVRP